MLTLGKDVVAYDHPIVPARRPPAREMDMLLATGEQESIALMAMAIQELGEKAVSFTGAQVGIVTDSFHTKARIKNISTERIRQALDEGKIVIVAGFQGIDENYNITTLGRGGSDTTAVALAAVMKHDRRGGCGEVDCEFYTDVDGIYTTDPRIVPEARKMDVISYDEMLELASVGANVLHSRSRRVRQEVRRAAAEALVVHRHRGHLDRARGRLDARRRRLRGGPGQGRGPRRARRLPDVPGVSHRVFSAIAAQNIAVDMIAQNVGTGGKASIGFTVPSGELSATLAVVRPLAAELGAAVGHDEEVSKVSVVGTGMRTHTGVAEKMFAALAAAGINMKMVTTGDIKISALVDKADGRQGAAGGPPGVRPARAAAGRRAAGQVREPGAVPCAGRPRRFRTPAATWRQWPSSCPAWRTSSSATCCSTTTRAASPSSTCRTGRASARASSRRWPPAASSWT